MNVLNLKNASLKTKIILGLVLLVLLWLLWYTVQVRSADYMPKTLKEMPRGSIQIVNDEDRTVTLRVLIADTAERRNAGFKRAGENTVKNSLLFYSYPRETNERHRVINVKAPLEMAFFSEDGTLLHIAKTQVGSTISYGVTGNTRYRYMLVAHDGYFNNHKITVNGESKLLIETLRR